MKSRLRTVAGFFLLFACLMVLWFFSVWDYATLHYRLTYEVETPDGVKTGSGVVYVRREDTTGLPLPNTGFGYVISGEAVIVDLGQGQYLFSLMENRAYALPLHTFENIRPKGMNVIEFTKWLTERKPSAPLPPEHIPTLATFEDIQDPTSVKKVDPANLSKTFGTGYNLKSVVIEITDDSVTQGNADSLLEWLNDYYNKRLDNRRFATVEAQNRFANSLSAGNFDTEKN